MTEVHDLDPQVGELLSALLDGQVTADERVLAQQWLDRSEAARDEYAALARVKSALHGLPAVDAPTGFYDRMLRAGSPAATLVPGSARDRAQRSWFRSPAAAVASVAATAAAWVFLGGFGQADRFVPALDGVAAAVTGDVGGPLTAGDGAGPLSTLGPLRADRTLRDGRGNEVGVLDDGRDEVAVLRQDGAVAWERLPEGRRAGDTWVDLTTPEGLARVVVARDGAVWTLASDDLDADQLLDLAATLPTGGDSTLLGRAREAGEALLGAFSGG